MGRADLAPRHFCPGPRSPAVSRPSNVVTSTTFSDGFWRARRSSTEGFYRMKRSIQFTSLHPERPIGVGRASLLAAAWLAAAASALDAQHCIPAGAYGAETSSTADAWTSADGRWTE